jgi:hypothetical protein
MRIRRRVRVLQVDLCSRRDVRIGPVEQRLPHDPAHQVELIPGLPERLTETRERSWNLQFLYVGHHNDQILVRNGLRVTEALDDQPASAGRTRNGRPPGPLKILK